MIRKLALVCTAGVVSAGLVPAQAKGLRCEVSFTKAFRAEATTGRVYVMFAKSRRREPRFQVRRTGVPFFGKDVVALRPGETATIDGKDLGSPIESLNDQIVSGHFRHEHSSLVIKSYRPLYTTMRICLTKRCTGAPQISSLTNNPVTIEDIRTVHCAAAYPRRIRPHVKA